MTGTCSLTTLLISCAKVPDNLDKLDNSPTPAPPTPSPSGVPPAASGAASGVPPAASSAAITQAQVIDMQIVMLSAVGDRYTEEIPERFGPGQFDCSGLVWFAANMAGISMPGGPSKDIAALAPYEIEWAASQAGALVIGDASQIQSGDLIGFHGPDPAPFKITVGGITVIGPGHIGMATSNTEYVSAYNTHEGVVVKPISGDVFLVAVRMQG